MVLLLGIDTPDILLVGSSGCYILNGLHRRKHRVIHIVIPMHAVAADKIQIRGLPISLRKTT